MSTSETVLYIISIISDSNQTLFMHIFSQSFVFLICRTAQQYTTDDMQVVSQSHIAEEHSPY